VCDQASGSNDERPPEQNADVPKRFDLVEAVRVGSVPVSLGASAWTDSWWLFLGAMVYNVASGPIHDLLAAVLGALGRRWSRHIDPA
jgi:hypothetical protein